MKRATAAVCLITLLAGCAAPVRPARPPAPSATLTPPPPAPPPPEPFPRVPPASVGPRVEAPPAEPPRVEAPPRPPAAPSIAPEVPAAQRGRFVVLNFDNADVETVIQAASEIVGFNYVLAPDVRGKVTVQTSGRIAQEEVFGVLLAILEVYGFTAVKAGNLYKIVRIEGARERAVPTIVGQTPDPRRTTDEIITQIVPLRYSSVAELSTLLRSLISTRGTLIAHRETNVLIITDTASNMRRLLDIIRLVDVQVAQEELQIIPIRFADASDLANILNQLFASGRIPGLAPGVPPTAPGTLTPPTAPPGVPGAAAQTGSAQERRPLIIAERRSNSLIVHAKKHEVETIKRLIAQLDINIYGGRRVFIYYAENAKAKDLTATLNQLFGLEAGPSGAPGAAPAPTTRTPGYTPPPPPPAPGAPPAAGATSIGEAGATEGKVKFIADEVTNAVIVATYPRLWEEIEGTIKQLDKMPRQVLIEVLVAEVTLTDDLRLGIDWAMRSGRFNVAGVTAGPPAIPTSGAGLSLPAPLGGATSFLGPIGQGLTAFTFETGRFIAILNTLASENRVNIVSNPHILTSENKKAVINVSRSIPIVTSQQVPIGGATPTGTGTTTAVVGTQSVEYRDAGVVLTVTPRIGEHGTVALDVKQEVNAIGNPVQPTGSPEIIKREAETSVVLLNNTTLVLGGLIQDQVTINDRGIPFLKDIPILRFLFGFKERRLDKTELLMLITPRVLGTAGDAAKLTDEMRRATPELERAIKRAPLAPSPTPPPPPASVPAPPPGQVPPATPERPPVPQPAPPPQ
ncbi:MAG: type II secretion system protein GspD [Candidatus Rokubacteria bacterium 13_2_20CM_2_70_11]|nr:MAG: type II secretion system protein GspD [Candidatus Rokubacteria bacterium 13_2_20CM_2_70_11]